MIRNLLKLWAFVKRDFLSEVSYRLAFLMRVLGMLFSLLAFFFLTKMIDPNTKGLDGIPPFDWLLVGLSFQFYFSTALYSFSARIRSEQLLGTLEAMLVSPTPTSIVIFSSAAWDFTYGAIRVVLYLAFAMLVFGVQFDLASLGASVPTATQHFEALLEALVRLRERCNSSRFGPEGPSAAPGGTCYTPYRCLLPKGLDGILVVGVGQIALVRRVLKTGDQTGQRTRRIGQFLGHLVRALALDGEYRLEGKCLDHHRPDHYPLDDQADLRLFA